MELLDGETLRQKLSAPISARKAVEYGVQMARALYAYALNRRLSRLFLVQGAR
jgi:hypothetical protein